MTEPTTPLGGADSCSAFIGVAATTPSDLRDHCIQTLHKLRGARARNRARSLARHLHASAEALDDAFNALIREAVLAPELTPALYKTALQSHVLFREIYEYLKRSEFKKSAKRTGKKTLGRRRLVR